MYQLNSICHPPTTRNALLQPYTGSELRHWALATEHFMSVVMEPFFFRARWSQNLTLKVLFKILRLWFQVESTWSRYRINPGLKRAQGYSAAWWRRAEAFFQWQAWKHVSISCHDFGTGCVRNEVQLKRTWTGPKEFAVRGECVLRAHFFLWRSRTLLRFISIGSLHLKDFKIMAGPRVIFSIDACHIYFTLVCLFGRKCFVPCKSKTHHFHQLIEFVLEICGCGPSGMDALRVRFSWHIQLTLNVLATLLLPKYCMRFTDAVLRPRKLVMNDLLTTRSKDKDTIGFGALAMSLSQTTLGSESVKDFPLSAT